MNRTLAPMGLTAVVAHQMKSNGASKANMALNVITDEAGTITA